MLIKIPKNNYVRLSIIATLIMASSLAITACQFGLAKAVTRGTELDKKMSALEEYKSAEALLPNNIKSSAKNLSIDWQWNGDSLWYTQYNAEELQYWQVELANEKKNLEKQPRFTQSEIKQALAKVTDEIISDSEFAVDKLSFSDDKFTINSADYAYTCWLQKPLKCERVTANNRRDGESPNKKWVAEAENYNIFLTHQKTGKKTALTTDGTFEKRYAVGTADPKHYFSREDKKVLPDTAFYWSKDSRYLLSFQLDLSKTGTLTLTQSVPDQGHRPHSLEYYYPAAGDKHIPEASIVVFDTHTLSSIEVSAPKVFQTYYGTPLWGDFEEDGYFYYVDRSRGVKNFYLRRIDPKTGEMKTLVTETSDTFVDPWVLGYWVVPEANEVIWSSERSGWQHLYLYDNDGTLKNAMTSGDLFVRVVRHIDADNRRVYFEASGTAHEGDPYYRYLYSVNFDGSDLKRLSRLGVTHETDVSTKPASDGKRYFIDTYSTVKQAPIHTLNDAETGEVLLTLAEADISPLEAQGYRPPEPFSVETADKKHQLYGVLYMPPNFDPNKKYPIIDDIYTGPHGFFTPKDFARPLRSQAPALAELGFIVMRVDGRGTGKRSRDFHEHSYKNLGGGVDDHVYILKKLAEERQYMDLTRVGIYGFSAGGYDTAHAMFKYPDFFKVAVSASGNHDFRVDKTGWNETWMGYPVDENWDEQSNITMAKHLKGRLLIAHGELDSNVHPGASMQLVDALIRADKTFDFMMYPGMGHFLDDHPHFVLSRWNYFYQHLAGNTPPKGYAITSMSKDPEI